MLETLSQLPSPGGAGMVRSSAPVTPLRQDVGEHRTCRVFVVDPHEIVRRGLETCLGSLPGVTVSSAADPAQAWAGPALPRADLVMVDPAGMEDFGRGFMCDVRHRLGAPVLICTDTADGTTITGALDAGACGVIAQDGLTVCALRAMIETAIEGSGVVSTRFLAMLRKDASAGPQQRAEHSPSPLAPRERQVLGLIAAGSTTREIALELSYAERTVKNILHDAVTKLGARSRSQAVANAVRGGWV